MHKIPYRRFVFLSLCCIFYLTFFQTSCSDESQPDVAAPGVGAMGNLTTSNVESYALTLHWAAATDNASEQPGLQYKVVHSRSNNIFHIYNAEANGTVALDWTANKTSAIVTNLAVRTTYFFTVIVKDEAGNKAVYVTSAFSTGTGIFAYTSFEECPVPQTNWYKDFGQPLQSHMLTNNPNSQTAPTNNIVHWVRSGSEIGFKTMYVARNGIGVTEGDKVGVHNSVDIIGNWSDGSKGYQIGDTDGQIEIKFDTVSLIGKNNPSVLLDIFISPAGGYAQNECLYIYYIGNTTTQVPITNYYAADLNANMGKWITLNASISSYTCAQLVVMGSNNQDDEIYYVDNIIFREN